MITEKQRKKFYASRLWKKRAKLQRQYQPLCENCLKQSPPVYTKAFASDHITGFTDWKTFIESPLQSLCKDCHNEKTHLFDKPKKQAEKITEFRFF